MGRARRPPSPSSGAARSSTWRPDIVQKLWNLCHILRDDGITYHQYVTELTYLLFPEDGEGDRDRGRLPKGYRWDDLKALPTGVEQLDFYRALLLHLGHQGLGRGAGHLRQRAQTALRSRATCPAGRAPRRPRLVLEAKTEGLGDLYEGLLEKNASETKSGAGQYFTPRPLIDCDGEVVKPQAGELVQDPAAGTGGFLIAADRLRQGADRRPVRAEPSGAGVPAHGTPSYGVELVPDTRRLALMNLMLHDIEGDEARCSATRCRPGGEKLPKAHVILTNPPFGTKKGGGGPTRDDFTYPTSNKQLAFLQHIYRGLKPGGRAAVVLPDNVLFEEGTGAQIRADLMDKCDLHTILRLPTGIFYAQGVKTNVLFFTRGARPTRATRRRLGLRPAHQHAPAFGKRTPFTREHFAEFEKAYGEDPQRQEQAQGRGREGRWRAFTREEIAKRGDNLDIAWLKEQEMGGDRAGEDGRQGQTPQGRRVEEEVRRTEAGGHGGAAQVAQGVVLGCGP
jgi:type I restriction enzyme M protein